jgi:hypothetical protein
MAPVSAGYLEAMGIPLVAGRTFRASDIEPPGPVVIVNEAFAARYFSVVGGHDIAVGKTIGTRFGSDSDPAEHEVIGVVSNTKYDLRQSPAPTIYIPIPLRAVGTIHVRGSGDLNALSMQLRETVRAGPPLFRVRAITTQNDAIAQTMLRERLLALLSAFFGVVGLTLAAIGLYGVLSYTVLQRTKEIGVRIALGAGQGQVVRSILKGIGSAAAIGVLCGLGGALYLSQFVRALLFEVTPLDFWSLALPLSAMMVVAVIAATIPGVRASRVDPVVALRRD